MPYNDADDDDLYFVLTSFNKGSLFNFHVNLPYGPIFFNSVATRSMLMLMLMLMMMMMNKPKPFSRRPLLKLR